MSLGQPELELAARQALELLEAQQNWMRECGGDEAGYVRNYGAKADPGHAGDGGEAIFEADLVELLRRRNSAVDALQRLEEAI